MWIRIMARNDHQRASVSTPINNFLYFFAYLICGVELPALWMNCHWGNIQFERITQLSTDFWYILYEAVCLTPAASLLDSPVSRNLQVFLCDKIIFGSGAWTWLAAHHALCIVQRTSVTLTLVGIGKYHSIWWSRSFLAQKKLLL